MRHSRWLLVVSALVLSVAEVHGQLIIRNAGFFPAYNGYYGAFNYSTRLGHGRLSLGLGGYGFGGFYGPGFYGPGFYPGYYGGFSQTTIIYNPQPIYVPVAVPVPVAVDPLDQLALDVLPPDALALARLRRPWLGMQPPAQPPPQPPAQPPRQPPQPPPQPPKQPPPPRQPPAPEKKPVVDEYARQIELGKRAFAGRSYGKAAQHFRLAIQANPKMAEAQFLLVQAQFALGKYPDAVDAIDAGMALQPDWPTARFRPRDLYGANAIDCTEHLRQLDQIVQANPNDSLLLFLYAYQLWFDGRREEARVWFRKALPGSAKPDLIQRFLRAV